MATEEKSRDAFEPRKRYAAVGMQQGRVLLDDDFNEAERIRIDEARQVNIDVIGPVGTPDTGFLISNGHLNAGGIDFEIGAGSLYLSGLRLWNPETAVFSLQDDWLQQTIADRPPPTEGRIDLVYVEAWQQPVAAVEDAELFEVALGGPDSSTRLRTMWRVQVAADIDGDDCPSAWQDLVAQWETDGLGTIDADFERVVDANLQVGFVAGQPGDLCTPSTASGYLGAENQTIRVELVDADHLAWGFDNGAPAYRATIDPDQRTITLVTEPRDQTRWPRAGQIVELLPWSALLPNGEKLSEYRGHLARVESSYNPDDGTLVLTAATAVPAGFGEAWQARADAAELSPGYVFLRVWDRGDDIASDPAIAFTPGTAIALGSTGLSVTITGEARVAGDHWIISARPRTPDQVVPWDLEVGRGVHGVRRFFAPLALVRWHRAGAFDLLHDCRPFFPPLTRIRGCCTYTVGDEVSSFGQFTSIQAAIDALPAEGGKVCVLPGTYREAVEVIDRENITLEGCGARSRIAPGVEDPWAVLILGGRNITVRDLGFATGDTFGIVIAGHTPGGPVPKSFPEIQQTSKDFVERIRLERLTMTVGGRAAICALMGRFLWIEDCEITAGPLGAVIDLTSDVGRWPAIVSFADDVLIERNHIEVPAEPLGLPGTVTTSGLFTFTRTPLGGIQIGGGSERVEIRRNQISGGNGDGVTLGSWAWAPSRVIVDVTIPWDVVSAEWIWLPGLSITINEDGCIEVDWDPPPPPGGGDDLVPVSMGTVSDVRIVDNQIRRMGRSGIGVARFFDLSRADQLIVVRRLTIETNRIEECVRLPIPPVPRTMRDVAAQGAITLADVEDLVVRDNTIRGNGKRHVDPVCGVFALVSTGAVLERNRITDNAPFVNDGEPVRPGWRGGIVLPHALPPSTVVPVSILGTIEVTRQDGRPAARIADNVIVVPDGRAITLVGQGPMSIVDNHLTSRGVGRADVSQLLGAGNDAAVIAAALAQGELQTTLDLMGGVVVLAVNNGLSNERQFTQLLQYLNVAGQDLGPQPGLDPRAPVAASGQILFDDNQVALDLLAAPINHIQSVVTLTSLDDVGMADNQIEVDRIFDRIVHTVRAQAFSTRVIGNRVKDGTGLGRAALQGLSIFSTGIALNMTTNNQTTRCIVGTVGLGGLKTVAPNQVLITLAQPRACDVLIGPSTVFEATHLDVIFVED